MLGTAAIRNLIREDKVAQMYSSIQTGNSIGMQTLDQNLPTWCGATSCRPRKRAARRSSPRTSRG